MRASPSEQRRRRPRILSLYSSLVSSGDVVFDIGANQGDRSEIFLSLGARVVAVEPQPSCLQYLRDRFGSDQRVEIVGMALDQSTGRARIHLSDNNLVSSMNREWIEKVSFGGRFDDSGWFEEIEVMTTTLDDLIELYGVPGFTKIDVEGHESKVLKGLSAAIPRLSFEYTPEFVRPAMECLDRLSSLGPYVYNLSRGESMEYAFPRHVQKDDIVKFLEEVVERKGKEESGDIYAVASGR